MQFLAFWARKLSWKEVAFTFHTSWEKVFQAVEYVVKWGKAQSMDNIKAIGVDEVAYQIGHKYLTVIYQIDRGLTRLLWVGEDRTENQKETSGWSMFALTCGSRKAIAEFGQALHILDRFIVAMLNKRLMKSGP